MATIPVTTSASADGPLGLFEDTTDTLPGVTGASVDGPYGVYASEIAVMNHGPVGPGCSSDATPITFDVVALKPLTIDLVTSLVEVNGETAFSAGAFQGAWAAASTVTDTSDTFFTIQSFSLVRTPTLGEGVVVVVHVEGTNSDEITSILDWSYLTCIAPAPPTPTATALVAPNFDTFRGGRQIMLTVSPAASLLDTSYDARFNGLTLPTGWSSAVTGTGSVTPAARGVVLESGSSASTVTLSRGLSLTSFDAYVTYEILSALVPRNSRASLILEGVTAAPTPASRAEIRIDLEREKRECTRTLRATVGPSTGALGTPPMYGVLRLARHTSRIWAELTGSDGVMHATPVRALTSLDPALLMDLQIRIEDTSEGSTFRVRIIDFVLRPAATVNDRLIDEPKYFPGNRLLGRVPEASGAEVGAADVAVFGHGVEALGPLAFTYTLPVGRVMSAMSASGRLVSYNDPQFRSTAARNVGSKSFKDPV